MHELPVPKLDRISENNHSGGGSSLQLTDFLKTVLLRQAMNSPTAAAIRKFSLPVTSEPAPTQTFQIKVEGLERSLSEEIAGIEEKKNLPIVDSS